MNSDQQNSSIECTSSAFTSPLVVSRGNPLAKIMLIGEAPGASEETMGVPFVGRSGKLLDSLLMEVGIDVEKEVYITNLVKSRPPNNRTPTKSEILLHIPWLFQQIKVIDPLIIVLLGSTALRAILGIKYKISEKRGTWQNWNGINMMPIFHPSYLLRNPSRSLGRPYQLTLLDLYQVKEKFLELDSTTKSLSKATPLTSRS